MTESRSGVIGSRVLDRHRASAASWLAAGVNTQVLPCRPVSGGSTTLPGSDQRHSRGMLQGAPLVDLGIAVVQVALNVTQMGTDWSVSDGVQPPVNVGQVFDNVLTGEEGAQGVDLADLGQVHG